MKSEIKNRRWYSYTKGNPLNPKSYAIATVLPGCSTGTEICAIYAKGYAAYPDEFSERLKVNIANALISGVPQPADSDYKYVVLKK